MMELVTFTIHGAPTPKGRARATRSGRQYTPAKTRMAEESVLAYWLAAHGSRTPHDGPVEVDVVSVFVPPVSWPKWRQQAALDGRVWHVSKPDVDNLLKLVADGLNGVAWIDDSQVFRVGGSKEYGATPRTVVTLTFHPRPSTKKENN